MKHYRFAIACMTTVFAALVATSPAPAQESGQPVDIGGVTLRLGDSRADTMDAAEQRLLVLPSRTSGYYNLYRKQSNQFDDGVQSIAIGALWFRDNRLISVTRNLGAFQSLDGRIAIDNLIAAFRQASEQAATRAQDQDDDEQDRPPSLPALTATTDETVNSNFSISRLYFTFPDRVIQIAVFEPVSTSQQASIDISEHYGLREDRPRP